MTEEQHSVVLAGKTIRLIRPSQGQLEQLIRIGRSINRGSEQAPDGFYTKQVGRIGDVIDQLIVEEDRDMVDDLYAAGLIDHTELLTAVLSKVKADEADQQPGKPAKKAASPARVRRR